ncbi:MAG: carboxypeptidase regulatory-like domain-containing protein, partial [Chitinophagaceae bacterium]
MKKLFSYLVSFLLCTTAWSQFSEVTIKGAVTDSTKQKTFAYTTVSITQAKDSVLLAFTQADSTGKFTLRGIRPGKYLLSATYVGYATAWQPLLVNGNSDIVRTDLILKDLKSLNNEVTVYAKRPPVVLNKDTLEFNTENFATQPNAVVEDLMKRLPGVTVDNDGTIKVNGQRVNRILVNGKEFFTGDPTIATKNLTADAIDKVQVFDRKSDRSQFTGFEDGQTEKAINLKLKKDKSDALFGRTTAGVGNNKRFDAQSNTNYFNKEEQLSFLGMANNTNKQGFSMTDVLNFTGELSRGMRSGGGGVSIRINTNGGDNNGLPVVG